LRLLRVETGESEYRRGQPVRVEVRAFGPDYRPAPRSEVNLSLNRISSEARPDGAEPPPIGSFTRAVRTDDEGAASAEWERLPPGGYRIVARAVLGGRPAE